MQRILDRITSIQTSFEPLQANIHLLRLLGDQLVGSFQLAVFELVKNSYDADAKEVTIILSLETEEPSIIVQDNGHGMDIETLRNGWLQLGAPLKRGSSRRPSEKFKRMPLGEKGIGRLAAFKLGNCLELTTRPEGSPAEYSLLMDLSSLLSDDSEASVTDVRVKINQTKPKVFPQNTHGTCIRITALNDDWERKQIRDLVRLVNTLQNPFKGWKNPFATENQRVRLKDSFRVELSAPGREESLEGLLDLKDIKERAIYRFFFHIDEKAQLHWKYDFKPPIAYKTLSSHTVDTYWKKGGQSFRLDRPADMDGAIGRPPKGKVLFEEKDLKGIGPLSGILYVFDRRTDVLSKWGGESRQVLNFLNEQAGIRLYRDGIRVYNYGEKGDDWLGMNVARVNDPGGQLATNAVLSAIELDLEQSALLEEKTNREGFIENLQYRKLKEILNAVIGKFNAERQEDREALDKAVKGVKDTVGSSSARFEATLQGIRKIAKEKGLEKELTPKIDDLYREFSTMQEVVLGSAASTNLAIIFHEADKKINELVKAILREEDITSLKNLAQQLTTLLKGFGELIRHKKAKGIKASDLISSLMLLNEGRFKTHKIVCSCPLLSGEDSDFTFSGAENHYLAAANNLIDNAIFWLRRAREEKSRSYTPAIAIRTLTDWASEGPAIAIIDNGPGFTIEPEQALRPFISGRNGGMGLGLYFAKTVMESQGGSLHIVQDISDLDIETPLNGSAVVLRFAKEKKR